MEHTSKHFTRVLDSVRIPIQHFIDTGIYDENANGKHNWSLDVSPSQVRRACRRVATELKRPFIQMSETMQTEARVEDPTSSYGHKWESLPEPRWARAHVSIPRRKYLAVLATPLILAANRDVGAKVYDRIIPSLWNFIIYDRQIWDDYYAFVMNDPVCRAARKLPVTA